MKRFLLISSIFALTMSSLLATSVSAQEMTLQTDDIITQKLSNNCDSIKTTLRRIHTNDALLRVNMGQVYTGISGQFMARLNSRLALNKINSTELVSTTNNFEQQRQAFGADYKTYEATISGLIKIDCKEKPAEFYAELLKARDQRSVVAQDVKLINASINEYQVGVERIQQSLVSGGHVNED